MDRLSTYAPVVPLRPTLRPPGGRLRLVPPLPRRDVPWGRYGAAVASAALVAGLGVAAVLRPDPPLVRAVAPPVTVTSVVYLAEMRQPFTPPPPGLPSCPSGCGAIGVLSQPR